MIQEKIKDIEQSIIRAEYGLSKLSEEIYFLNGMSSPKVRRLLNNLGRCHERYCEVGSWRGSTIISATFKNDLDLAVAIDDFSQFEKKEIFCVNPLINLLSNEEQKRFLYESTPREELQEKLSIFAPHVEFIEGDYRSEEVQAKVKDYKFDLYLFDGDHTYQAQYDGVVKMYDKMDDVFTLCVDDWGNSESGEVRLGTYDALYDLKAKIHYEWAGKSNGNGDIENYWNGFYVAVIEK